MRILVVSNLYPPHYIGGYELRCRDITEALKSRGHEMQVLTSDHTLANVADEPHDYVVERTLKLHGFFGHPWLSIGRLEAQELHNNAILRHAIERFKPDLVHVWNLGGISKSLVLTLQRLNVPTVFDVSDHWIAQSLKGDVWIDWWNRSNSGLASKSARSFTTALGKRRRLHDLAPTNPLRHMSFARLYFCSKRLRQIAVEAGYDVAHGEVINCPVNTDRYHGEVKPASQPVKKLLYAGRLSEDKGILTALQAMRALKGSSDVELHVYGKGEPLYEAMLRGYVAQHDLPVSFHRATPDQMPDVYRQHDALLFTSEWEEPFALTPLEAMASGLPVIGTTTGGSAELLKHNINALTYTAVDAQALATQIIALQRDGIARERMARAGQEEVRRRLTLPIITSQIETYLTDTLAQWSGVSLPLYNEP